MENSYKICKNYIKYSPLYTRFIMSFEKFPKGYCSKKDKIVEPTCVCKNWQRTYTVTNAKKRITTKMLCKMAEDLNVIRTVFVEEDEDN